MIESHRPSWPADAANVVVGAPVAGEAMASATTGTGAEQVTRMRMPGLTVARLAAADGSTRSVRSPVLRSLAFGVPAGTSPSRKVMLGAAASIVTTSTTSEAPVAAGAAATVLGGAAEAVGGRRLLGAAGQGHEKKGDQES